MSYQPIRQTDIIAKKTHRCIWCGEDISIGTPHIHEVSKYNGDFQDHRWHQECHNNAKFGDEGEFLPYDNIRGGGERIKIDGRYYLPCEKKE